MNISATEEDHEIGGPGEHQAGEKGGHAGGAVGAASQDASDEHRFQKAIFAWRSIDLGSLIPRLDSAASDIVTNQRDALVQRKDVAQKTKDFRKLGDEAKLAEIKALLKAYQGFIDLLTTHTKTTSSAFLQVYSTISEAPDPYPLLEASVESLLLSEDTLPRVTAENEQLKRTVHDLTSDLERSEQNLEQERRLRKDLEESRDTKSKAIEASWQAVLLEKKDNWAAKERSLEERVENQDRLLSELKASYEVSQRLGQGQDDESDKRHAMATAAELDIVSSDLERTSQRLAEVEARNEHLRVELAQASGSTLRHSVEDDPAFTRLRSENASLLRKLEAARFDKDSETRNWELRIRSLERDAQILQNDRAELKEKLHRWRDYDDIFRELEIFKTVEFSTGDDEDLDGTTNGDTSHLNFDRSNGATGLEKDSLEQMLLARNKKVVSEMAVLRVAHQNLQQELEELRESLSVTNAALERSQNLNVTLENDLVSLQQEASNTFLSSARSTTSRLPPQSAYPNSPFAARTRRSSPTSSIISGFDSQKSPLDSLETPRSADGGGSGILPMVQAQRDRFKQKASSLEAELSKQYTIISSLRQEVASLQQDNLNLYEKTRYASTYNRGQQASSASAYAHNPSESMMELANDRSDDRYRSAYEAKISPFAAFRGRETTRAYKRMSLPERTIFSITRLVLANRSSRNLFAGYCIALHVLIFVMLYWMQGADVQAHASRLSDASMAAGGAGIGAAGLGNPDHGDWHQEGLDGGKPG